MVTKTLFFSIIVAFVSSILGMLYAHLYYKLFDFSSFLPLWNIVVLFTFISLILGVLSILFFLIFKKAGSMILSGLICVLSLLSVILPTLFPPQFASSIESPEIFPAFAVPLHFIIPMVWLTLSPLLLNSNLWSRNFIFWESFFFCYPVKRIK